MGTVNQLSYRPTNKLTASILAMVAGSIVFQISASYWPPLAEIEVAQFGDMELVFQALFASLAGYWVKDQPNT